MSRRPSATSSATSTLDDDVFMFDRADEFLDGGAPTPLENVNVKVREAQERLTDLRAQQEEIEKQKLHLEVLRGKQERFVAGKRDLSDKLSRSVAGIERDLYDAQKLVEELSITKDTFTRHLDVLKSLQPERWQPTQVDDEMDRALCAIEDAGDDYTKCSRRLQSTRPGQSASLADLEIEGAGSSALFDTDDAGSWMRRGFAFTLPLMGAIFLALLLAKFMF